MIQISSAKCKQSVLTGIKCKIDFMAFQRFWTVRTTFRTKLRAFVIEYLEQSKCRFFWSNFVEFETWERPKSSTNCVKSATQKANIARFTVRALHLQHTVCRTIHPDYVHWRYIHWKYSLKIFSQTHPMCLIIAWRCSRRAEVRWYSLALVGMLVVA